jgi:phosphohistidine phosphatase
VILYLLRHAKSSWSDPGLADHDRPLSPRGERAALRMGAWLAGRPVLPSTVLCSTARRATETLERVLSELPDRPQLRITRRLYHADPEELLGQIRETDDAIGALLLVGHNPGIEEFALALAGSGDPRALRRIESKYPTAGLAEIHFDCRRWHEVDFGKGVLRDFRIPKDLV